ncbi:MULTISPECIES: GntR family transcriptional regulator [Rhizobium/Agrobacterium group]|uniref:Transcriptional regulator GntR family n=2 Tax=Rhizobium/Agrobacterium group TaxID=227290 RepID=B9K5Q9_ALLAM|nr:MULTISPECIES: GntR family transcriptional regulator [Rhizobium/Agrobacterium group]ACM40207.1 transcriptional regulator GntR family [Allorhizobium ampelinum S4]MCF1449139.1 GntR family transcriptional regulator [Allorhizobium ampelinum]MCF1494953.1 GntR family transcriptional regulator [Allorhizobium ampelinum]MUO28321.1 FCD domain-containing protein [Agrobacterium vitis]MUO41203.1 FCD domain-containing protein [Agrobacterium vitis]
MKKVTRRQSAKVAPKAGGAADTAENANDDVTERIRITLATAIGEGALKPGVKILEDAIADHFGVSRTVVRGALGVLESDHLLERKKNRGTFVAEPGIEEAKALFEARRKLEHVILELVIDRATVDQLDALEKLTDEEEHIHHHGDEKSKTVLSGKFHVVLAELGGNAVMTEMLSKIVARLSLVMSLYEEERKDDCGADHHRLIVSAIKAKDLAKAQQLMDHHLADIEGRVRLTEGQGDRHTFLAVLENFS